MPWVSLQCVIVVFTNHTVLLTYFLTDSVSNFMKNVIGLKTVKAIVRHSITMSLNVENVLRDLSKIVMDYWNICASKNRNG